MSTQMVWLGFAAVARGISLHCSSEMFMFLWAARYFERMVKHPGDYFAIFIFAATLIFLYMMFSKRWKKKRGRSGGDNGRFEGGSDRPEDGVRYGSRRDR